MLSSLAILIGKTNYKSIDKFIENSAWILIEIINAFFLENVLA